MPRGASGRRGEAFRGLSKLGIREGCVEEGELRGKSDGGVVWANAVIAINQPAATMRAGQEIAIHGKRHPKVHLIVSVSAGTFDMYLLTRILEIVLSRKPDPASHTTTHPIVDFSAND